MQAGCVADKVVMGPAELYIPLMSQRVALSGVHVHSGSQLKIQTLSWGPLLEDMALGHGLGGPP
jgi:hypothetical protein